LIAGPVAAFASELDTGAFEFAQIVVLGEVHDNPAHHETQARIVAALEPDAIVFEMIGAAEARRITRENRGDAGRLSEVLNWSASGWPDFAMYFPIFAAAPEAAIYGGAFPRDGVRRAVSDGASAVFGDSAPLFGLDRPLPEEQLAERIDLQRIAHCDALPENLLPGMVEAQRLRDAALAKATVAAFAHASAVSENPRVVVIAGNGHARDDWGVPSFLRHYYQDSPEAPTIASLGQYEVDPPEDAPFSATGSAPAPEREDPCLAFAR
jgi:uncharacterized iron-regulated protein